MPRTPTGNPRGRPKGTGRLGEQQTRLTVRIPQALYTRLEAFAESRSYTRGTPRLAVCVREALEQYLARPYKRQTQNTPSPSEPITRQTKNVPEAHAHPAGVDGTNISQPINGQEEAASVRAKAQAEHGDNNRQTEKSTSVTTAPSFDTTKYILGQLCPRGHEYAGTGHSLLRIANHGCIECDREKAKERRQAKQPPSAGGPQQPKAALLAQLRRWQQDEALGPQAIADRLNANQEPTFSGRGQWSRGTVSKLLSQQAHSQGEPAAATRTRRMR